MVRFRELPIGTKFIDKTQNNRIYTVGLIEDMEDMHERINTGSDKNPKLGLGLINDLGLQYSRVIKKGENLEKFTQDDFRRITSGTENDFELL